MKKTLVALLALSGIAMAADNSKTVEILTLPETIAQVNPDQHGAGWSQGIGKPGTLSAEAVASCLTSSAVLASEGWHWSLGNNSWDNVSNDVLVSQDTKTIKFKGRNGYNGEILAATMDVAALLSQNSGEALTALTFSFVPTQVSQASFSVWHYNGETADALVEMATLSNSEQAQTYTVGVDTPLDLKTGKIFMLFNSTAGGADQYISGFSAAATISQSVPEPTTGALSLLALAGLCIRRRK